MPVKLARWADCASGQRRRSRGGVLWRCPGPAKLYRYGDLTFFDCAGVRLLLEKVAKGATVTPQGVVYFRCADIAVAVRELSGGALPSTASRT